MSIYKAQKLQFLEITPPSTTEVGLKINGVATLGSTTGASVSDSGVVTINNTATSTSKDTGCLIVEGGIGVEENVNVGGTLAVTGVSTLTGSLKANSSLNWLGCKKFQSFAGSLASIGDGSTLFTDNDVLVELGTLDTTVPAGHVAATKFFIDKVVIGITTAAGQTLTANMNLSATSGTLANAAVSSGTEIVGAGVASFNPRISATDAVTEIDINMNAVAGSFHVFTPNITAPIASKYLYLCQSSDPDPDGLNADATAGRFTVMLEYTLF